MALAETLRAVDELRKEANSLRSIATERIKVLYDKLRLDWNYNSNAIEGNTLTLSETKVLLRTGIHAGNKLGRHYEEIKLHDNVLSTLEEIVRRNEPLTEVLIRSLHHQLMGDEYFVSAVDSMGNVVNVKGRPGEYKIKANGVNRIVNGKELFVPFKTPEEVRSEMPELIQWYRGEEEKGELHPVMIAAIFHFRFVTLHPFDDGNGRMSRILMNMILMRAGYAPAIIRMDERSQYNANLALAQDGGTIEPFIDMVAIDTLRSLELLVKAAKGESIEEPDDLDKEIELLKRNLNTSNDYIASINNSSIRVIWQTPLQELLLAIESKLQKFSVLFEKQISYATKGQTVLPNYKIKGFAGIFSTIIKDDVILIEYTFLTYKQPSIKSFDSKTSIEFKFHSSRYVITYLNEHSKPVTYDYPYHHAIDTDTIDKIANDMAKVILKEIKEKTASK